MPQLTDPVSTKKLYKNEALRTYESDISLLGDTDNFTAHKDTPWGT